MKKPIAFGWKYAGLFLVVMFVFLPISNYGEGLGDLAGKTANSILDYFSDQYNIKAGIIKFENTAGISDLTAQRFYQLLISKLETAANFSYTDLMINFHQNKGEFNLNRIYLLNHLVYLKLTRNRNKIGAGIVIFSRTLDKIVFIKYVEELFTAEEREIYLITNFGFNNAGFAKIMEMEARQQLLDLESFLDQKGRLRFLFYYPGKIEFFKLTGDQLVRVFSHPLYWGKPYYPVMEDEGKLCVFFQENQLYAVVGNNFSRTAKVLTINEDETGTAAEVDTIDFTPFRIIELNEVRYLAGARYTMGKNYFENNLMLLPFQFNSGQLVKEKYFVKELFPFYCLDFSISGASSTLDSIHIIDRDYRYRFLADNFQQLSVEEAQRGGALCCLDGQWLAVSDYSQGSDQLYFYSIEKGSRRLVYQNKVKGEIIFISDGLWKAAPGFWVYLEQLQPPPAAPEYKLQFWSKKSE